MAGDKSVDSIIRRADKLLLSDRCYSPTKKPGYLRLANGGWRDPLAHEQLVALYTDASQLEGPPYFALFRRASANMMAGFLDEALADLKLLQDKGSSYSQGIFPLQLHMLRGEAEIAQKYLDEINVKNKDKGLPKQRFSDFRLK